MIRDSSFHFPFFKPSRTRNSLSHTVWHKQRSTQLWIIFIVFPPAHYHCQTLVFPYCRKPALLRSMVHTSPDDLQCPGPHSRQCCRVLSIGLVYIDPYRTGAVCPGLRGSESCVRASGEDCGSSKILGTIDFVYDAVAVVSSYGVEKVQGFEAMNGVAGEETCWMTSVGSRRGYTEGRSMYAW